MYARIVTAHVQPDKLDKFPSAFGEHVLPSLSQERGFKGIYVMKDHAQNKVVALVLWETEADASASEANYLRERLPKMAPLLVSPPTFETLEVLLRA
jgi:heme-degrading monooxygenase HmoA